MENLNTTPYPIRTPYWQQPHLGRLLGYALQRFDARVMALMVQDVEVPLNLSNLAARGQINVAHIHITRHLPPQGARLTELAQHAQMSKQAMNDLVDQCEAWGIIERTPDPQDRRAKRIQYTTVGITWLNAFTRAVTVAEEEFKQELGAEVATVIHIGLEAYASAFEKTS